MNNQKEDIKKAAEVAQFRFGVIAPVVQDLYPDPSRTAYYKRVASSPFTLPDGSVVEYNYKTIEKWVSMYQRGGLEALMPHMYSVFKAVTIEKSFCKLCVTICEKFARMRAL